MRKIHKAFQLYPVYKFLQDCCTQKEKFGRLQMEASQSTEK